jgi:phosphoglucomutase
MAAKVHELAGKVAPREILVNVPRLVTSYFARRPDPAEASQRVAFGTSGHRGSSFQQSFNEAHVLAISQAIVEYRRSQGTTGPLFIGMDTHALSEPALVTAVEVFAAADVEVVLEQGLGYTPTPVVSHAVLTHNRGRAGALADGVVITPSHNPPDDGGFKYNPPTGGPADEATTQVIETRANQLLEQGLQGVKRVPWSRASAAATTHQRDNVAPYVQDLRQVIDLESIARARLHLGVHPLGGASVAVWGRIADAHGLDIEVVDARVDPTFSFMTVDHDGKIRMDCSSPYAMASLVALKDRFDLAFGNDGDADRHGVVTKSAGLLPPNHFLAVCVQHLFATRDGWPKSAAVGKTLVSSSMIDRVCAALGRRLAEVPVGFKWFVDGLLHGSMGFGGEESAGASFLRKDGTVWTTDKDGPVMNLLAAEILARTGRDPGEHYRELEQRFGTAVYERVDAPATPAQKAALKRLDPDQLHVRELAGETIKSKLSRAPDNGAAIGGIKVVTENGWFAARPSGTENVYKIYAESFLGADHLRRIQSEAQAIVDAALAK